MADEEVMGAASPAPSDHKRKLDDLDSEPFEQPLTTAESNGNSESVADGDGDAAPNGVSPEDSESKRPRLDDKPDFEATENGHQDEREEEPQEEVTGHSVNDENTDLEEGQEKADEPVDGRNNESLADETHPSANEQQSAENPEEAPKEEIQQPDGEGQDHAEDSQQEDVSGMEQKPKSSDQLTSRKMEVPNNKVGVLIGKSGDTIRTLQYNSGARIQITRDADADPYSATRPVELIGSLDNINKAERLIKDVIAEADAGGSPSLVARGFSTVQSTGAGEQIQIPVPNEKVGLIIGRGGETIKNLQTRSGARIQLIPQHLPEGDQSKERTVRVTGDKKQIEIARELIKEAMNQPIRSSAPSSGYNQQNFRPRGPGPQWGPRGHPSQSSGYDYPQRGPYPSQNAQYPSQGYGNYPPQQPPPRNMYGWEQRPPTNMQGPPEQTGYDYYGGQGGHTAAPPAQPPMHSHAPGPVMGPPPSQGNYNYGQQGPDYGQQPTPYAQTAPQGYGHGYGDPKYDQGPQHPYGGHGTQPSAYPQGTTHPGYGQDQYNKPPAYSMPQQGPYTQPYGQPRPSQPGEVPYQGPANQAYGPNAPAQQPYPYTSGQQGYPQYGTAPATNDGYSHPAPASGGYPQQSAPTVSGYAQSGQPQAPSYAQAGPTAGYGQYPSGYGEQPAQNNAGYGYQGAADPAYAGGPGAAYGAPPAGQPAYPQPTATQPGFDQSAPQPGGYANVPPVAYGKSASPQPQQPQAQAPAGYAQYDGSQIYAGHR